MAEPGPPARVVWMAKGRDEATLRAFFDELGPECTGQLEAVSTDMADWYIEATPRRRPTRRCASTPSTSSSSRTAR